MAAAKRDRQRLLDVFMANAGEVLTNQMLAELLGQRTDSWTRRLRELREPTHGGYTILTHRDRPDLRPGQYLFPPQAYRTSVTVQRLPDYIRSSVLLRDAYTCQLCGLSRGQHYEDAGVVSMRVRPILNISGCSLSENDCATFCIRCSNGDVKLAELRPSTSTILQQVRRLPRSQQEAVFEFLRTIFSDE